MIRSTTPFLAGLVLVGAAIMTASAQGTRDEQGVQGIGISDAGSVQAAIDAAVANAATKWKAPANLPDSPMEWEVDKIFGSKGGMLGLNRVKVMVSVSN